MYICECVRVRVSECVVWADRNALMRTIMDSIYGVNCGIFMAGIVESSIPEKKYIAFQFSSHL